MDPFVKHLPDGRTAYVTPLITALGGTSYTAVDGDGWRITGGWLYDAAERGVAPEKVPSGCTHLIPGLVPVWFTPEDVEQLTALGEAAKAAFDASAEGRQLDAWRRGQAEQTKASAARTAVLTSPEGRALVARLSRPRRRPCSRPMRNSGPAPTTMRAATRGSTTGSSSP
ncbi:hypothetical protein ACF1BP_23820 [Streptomyces sp. NPDC014735]|uniref:hypothetical protein n=1 Tax=Streptomyces sp. NPDC014735 TaxID=3364887 RepID=UPI003701E9EA